MNQSDRNGKIKILVVEDEMIVALEIVSSLKNLGFDAHNACPSGEKALERVEELKPDFVLMDIRLSGEMDGIQAARIIQQQHGIPIIYLSASTEQATYDKAMATAPLAFLRKPLNNADLKRLVAEYE